MPASVIPGRYVRRDVAEMYITLPGPETVFAFGKVYFRGHSNNHLTDKTSSRVRDSGGLRYVR